MNLGSFVAWVLIAAKCVAGRSPPTLRMALEGQMGHGRADGYAVRWVRRVNTRRLVRTVLQDRKNKNRMTMIQGDVLAHPVTRAAVMSFTTADQSKHVTLEAWFTELKEQTRHRHVSNTGIRLNILYENTTALVISTAGRLQDRFSHQGANGPFWLHADVLQGPNAKHFARLTTEIAWLLRSRDDVTITARVDTPEHALQGPLAIARECVDKSRVFVDADYPTDWITESVRRKCPSKTWDDTKWAILKHTEDPDLVKTEFGLIMLGRPSSTLRSENHFQAPNGTASIPKQQVKGTVHFVAPETEEIAYPNDTKYIPTLVIHLKETGDPTPIAPVVGSIRAELNAKGRLYLEDARDPTVPVGLRRRASADFCQFPCYDLLLDDHHDRVVFRVRLSQLCTGLNSSNVQMATGADAVRTLTLKIDHGPPQPRYKRHAQMDQPVQSSWVFVEGGGQTRDGNRIILENLAHRPLTHALIRAGFNRASSKLFLPTAAFVNILFFSLVMIVDF